MASATLNLRLAPRRMLSLGEAAEYVGVTVKHFARDCTVQPVQIASRKLYDIRDLDAWIDGIKDGIVASDEDIISRL